MTDQFLSCDWGTSSFRSKLVTFSGLKVIGEEHSKQGIAATFNAWEQEEDKTNEHRLSFYFAVVAHHIRLLEQKLNYSLDHVPIVLSGMASSSIGIIDIPYTDVPFTTDGRGLHTHLIKATDGFRHDVLIISGARTTNDVMRGEETELIGCIDEVKADPGDKLLFIFPGTHSKHISVSGNAVTAFTTFMTGEIFALLSNNSVLHSAVEKHQGKMPSASFEQGVKDGAATNLLHAAFMVRTNLLFSKLSRAENYDYLSGLCIGNELKELQVRKENIYLCCNSYLEAYYYAALKTLGITERVHVIPSETVERSAIKGQYKILLNTSSDAEQHI